MTLVHVEGYCSCKSCRSPCTRNTKTPRSPARIDRVDSDDWPVIASALVLGCPIWTEDRDFFGTVIPTWTTGRVELYLAHTE